MAIVSFTEQNYVGLKSNVLFGNFRSSRGSIIAGRGKIPKLSLADPMAHCLMDLVTGSQLRIIRELSRESGFSAELVCTDLLNCHLSELSRSAASAFIAYLENIPQEQQVAA